MSSICGPRHNYIVDGLPIQIPPTKPWYYVWGTVIMYKCSKGDEKLFVDVLNNLSSWTRILNIHYSKAQRAVHSILNISWTRPSIFENNFIKLFHDVFHFYFQIMIKDFLSVQNQRNGWPITWKKNEIQLFTACQLPSRLAAEKMLSWDGKAWKHLKKMSESILYI